MAKVLISLIGEQPVPNLLPIYHLKPEEVILVYTNFTQQVFKRLKRLLKPAISVNPPKEEENQSVDPYDIPRIVNSLFDFIKKNKWDSSELIFNLTGGTKPMGFAAFEVAKQLNCHFVYLQSQGSQSKLFFYKFDHDEVKSIKCEIIPEAITLHDYLMSFLDGYTIKEEFESSKGWQFEKAVYQILEPKLDECFAGVKLAEAIDIDLVCRLGNQVAIVEVKQGEKARKKEGIDQLNTAGSREFLGTYTKKVLVIDRVWDHTRSNLRRLAEAHQITLIELPSFSASGIISEDEAKLAVEIIHRLLGKK